MFTNFKFGKNKILFSHKLKENVSCGYKSRQRGRMTKSTVLMANVINRDAVQNLLASFHCVLGKNKGTLRHFSLLGDLSKQLEISIVPRMKTKTKQKISTRKQYLEFPEVRVTA